MEPGPEQSVAAPGQVEQPEKPKKRRQRSGGKGKGKGKGKASDTPHDKPEPENKHKAKSKVKNKGKGKGKGKGKQRPKADAPVDLEGADPEMNAFAAPFRFIPKAGPQMAAAGSRGLGRREESGRDQIKVAMVVLTGGGGGTDRWW